MATRNDSNDQTKAADEAARTARTVTDEAARVSEQTARAGADVFRHGTDTDSGRRTRLGFLCGREAGRLVRHEARRQATARVAGHLSVEDLEAGFRSARDPTATRHFQVIWLLARGHTESA